MSASRLAVLAAAVLTTAAAQAAPDCALKQLASVPATIGSRSLILDVTVNGNPARVWLDTGASAPLLNTGYLARIGLSPMSMPAQLRGIDGIASAQSVEVKSFGMGQGTFADRHFAAGSWGEAGPEGPNGILGAGFLRNYDIEIDPAGGKVNLFSQDHCRGSVVYWADSWFELPLSIPRDAKLWVETTLDGQRVHAALDTGASRTVLQAVAARRLFGLTPESAGGWTGSAIGMADKQVPEFKHTFQSLALGPITLRNPAVVVAQFEQFKEAATGTHIAAPADMPDMLIGMDILGRFHSYIAYGEEKLYFTLANEHRARDGATARVH